MGYRSGKKEDFGRETFIEKSEPGSCLAGVKEVGEGKSEGRSKYLHV